MSEKFTITPTPSEDEVVAITVAIEKFLAARRSSESSQSADELGNNWRLSGRWWLNNRWEQNNGLSQNTEFFSKTQFASLPNGKLAKNG